jgi:hypothetical protein
MQETIGVLNRCLMPQHLLPPAGFKFTSIDNDAGYVGNYLIDNCAIVAAVAPSSICSASVRAYRSCSHGEASSQVGRPRGLRIAGRDATCLRRGGHPWQSPRSGRRHFRVGGIRRDHVSGVANEKSR